MERTDVLIVGAGLAGASLAWHLAGSRRVLCVEQADQPCAEASAQNAGMVRRLAATAPERAMACRTHALLTDLPDGGRDWEESPPFRRTGAVIGLEGDDDALEDAAADLERRGVAIEAVTGERIARIAPALAKSRLRRAWWLPEEGVCDSWSLGQGFLRGAVRQGAEIRLGVRVDALIRESGRVIGVHTDRGPIRAELVVLAAGAWSRTLARTADVDRPLAPLGRHLFSTSPHELSNLDHPWCWIDDAGIYVRPEAGGFLCSPCDETEREPAPGPGSARRPDAYWRAVAHDKLTRSFPALAGLRLTGGWIGLRTFAPHRHPVAGLDPELDGLGWLAGLGGFGVSCAFALGETAADALTRGLQADFGEPAGAPRPPHAHEARPPT